MQADHLIIGSQLDSGWEKAHLRQAFAHEQLGRLISQDLGGTF